MNQKYDIFFDEINKVYQVRTKGDVIIIEFSDEEKEEIFKDIIACYNKKNFYTFKQLTDKLGKQYPHDKILDVVQELSNCSLLDGDNFEPEQGNESAENSMPVWMDQEFKDLNDIKLGFIGDSAFGERLQEKAQMYEYKGFEILTVEEKLNEKNIQKIFRDTDFLLVDLTNWNPYYIEFINDLALQNDKPWLLIDGAIDAISFSIGPIFHGKETGCYECYRSRIRSNDEFLMYTDAYEKYLRKGKKTSKPQEVSLLVKDFASTIILMDISKYIGGWYVPETWRASLILNSTNYSISRHDFLKAPLCYKCKPELDYNSSPWFESVTLNS